jgi:hypothetical protein
VVGVALLLFAVADHPSSGYVIALLVLAVLAWLTVEFLARTAPVGAPLGAPLEESIPEPTSATAVTEPVPAPAAPSAPAEPSAVTVGAPARTIELDTEASRESAGHGSAGG